MDNLPKNIEEKLIDLKHIWQPPAELFVKPDIKASRINNVISEEPRPIFDRMEYTPEGRPLMWFLDFKYPYKGIQNPFIMDDLNQAKNISKNWMELLLNKYSRLPLLGFIFTPWKGKIELLTYYFDNWLWDMEQVIGKWYFDPPKKYKLHVQEMGWFVQNFLSQIGFTRNIAPRAAMALMTIWENDPQYTMPLMDAFYQIGNKTTLLNNPESEIDRLAGILIARDNIQRYPYKKLARIAKWALQVPKIRRIFKQCVEDMTLQNLYPDKIDFYWQCRQSDYNYDGLSFEKRWSLFEKEHTDPKTGEVLLPRLIKFTQDTPQK